MAAAKFLFLPSWYFLCSKVPVFSACLRSNIRTSIVNILNKVHFRSIMLSRVSLTWLVEWNPCFVEYFQFLDRFHTQMCQPREFTYNLMFWNGCSSHNSFMEPVLVVNSWRLSGIVSFLFSCVFKFVMRSIKETKMNRFYFF